MNEALNNVLAMPSSLLPVDRYARPQNGVRVRRRQALLREELPYLAAADPLDDTLTEMEGLARNPNATGAYAGSF